MTVQAVLIDSQTIQVESGQWCVVGGGGINTLNLLPFLSWSQTSGPVGRYQSSPKPRLHGGASVTLQMDWLMENNVSNKNTKHSNSYYLKHRKIRTLKVDAQRIQRSIQMTCASCCLTPKTGWMLTDFCNISVWLIHPSDTSSLFLMRNPQKWTRFTAGIGREMYTTPAPSLLLVSFSEKEPQQRRSCRFLLL